MTKVAKYTRNVNGNEWARGKQGQVVEMKGLLGQLGGELSQTVEK